MSTTVQGGLAYPDDSEVQRIASKCLQQYDAHPSSSGSMHAQSQRFLNSAWKGLEGISNMNRDPPLRALVETLASGEATVYDFFTDVDNALAESGGSDCSSDIIAKRSFLYWTSAFRSVLWQNIYGSFIYDCGFAG